MHTQNTTVNENLDLQRTLTRKTHGSGDYKRINRPNPSRRPGFDNQSYGP